MTTGRTRANLAAVAVASVALLAYGLVQLASAVSDPTYPLSVRLPESGGLLADQEVTVAGRAVGVVDDVELAGDGVVAHLSIDDGQHVPVGSTVWVLRRSAIGEQAINFTPPTETAGDHAPGDVIEPDDVMLPVDVQDLVESADDLLGAIDADDAATVVRETAHAVRGRGDSLRWLLRDAGDVADTIAARAATIDRAAASGRVAIDTLAEARTELSAAITDTAGAAETLAALRGDLDALETTAPDTLERAEALLVDARPGLACGIEHLAALAGRVADPKPLDDLETALARNQWFFEGIRAGAPRDEATGNIWARLRVLPPQSEVPRSHLPDKRPVPPVTPGGSCDSLWGPGHGPATQEGFEVIVPDADFVPPDR